MRRRGLQYRGFWLSKNAGRLQVLKNFEARIVILKIQFENISVVKLWKSGIPRTFGDYKIPECSSKQSGKKGETSLHYVTEDNLENILRWPATSDTGHLKIFFLIS